MKKSKRLNIINNLIEEPYDEIWDCCCDHGLLGFQLLSERKSSIVHFVDCVPKLIDTVESKLLKHCPLTQQSINAWQVHTLDMLSTPLPLTKDKKHLIIIAGVGGDLALTFIKKILKDHKSTELDFILCPVHHIFQLRESLSNLPMKLISEEIVNENKRFYEIIYLRYLPKTVLPDSHDYKGYINQVSLVGDSQWDYESNDHKRYVDSLIKHYTRRLKGASLPNDLIKLEQIVQAYSSLLVKFK